MVRLGVAGGVRLLWARQVQARFGTGRHGADGAAGVACRGQTEQGVAWCGR